MILSDRDIRAQIEAGRVVIDPFDPACVQPSSVDLHVDSQFRVFANNRYPFIDVHEEQPDLTELVEMKPDEPFILHPGEFVLGSTLERVVLPDDLVARLGREVLARAARPADPLDGRLRRSRMGRLPDPRAQQRGEPADHAVPGHEDRADLVLPPDLARRDALRRAGNKYQGQRGPTPSRFYRDFA